jgi:hypothetical protein
MTAENIRLGEMKDRRFFSPEPGLSRQVLAYTGKVMLVRHLMEKGWVGPRHGHPHEQLLAEAASLSYIYLGGLPPE